MPGAAAAVSVLGGVPPVVGSCPRSPRGGDRYSHRADQPFRLTLLHPHATFGADVDSASYANLRRFLSSGQLPPADAVRIEELLNAFRYADREPADGGEPFTATAELGPCPWRERHHLLRLGLQSRRVEVGRCRRGGWFSCSTPRARCTAPTGCRWCARPCACWPKPCGRSTRWRSSVMPARPASCCRPPPATALAAILSAIDRLEAGGSTAGAAGIQLAYQLATGMKAKGVVPRVLLATDGDFNVGVSDQGELVRLIEKERERGIQLSVLGFGRGNLNDATMELLADRGNGNYSYIDSLEEARRVLIAEGGATLHTVAKDLKLQVEWNPAEVAAWRLLGYENRMMAAEAFSNDRQDGGELGAGHHVTALFELVPPGVELPEALRGAVAEPPALQRTRALQPVRHAGELGLLRLRYQPPAGRSARRPASRSIGRYRERAAGSRAQRRFPAGRRPGRVRHGLAAARPNAAGRGLRPRPPAGREQPRTATSAASGPSCCSWSTPPALGCQIPRGTSPPRSKNDAAPVAGARRRPGARYLAATPALAGGFFFYRPPGRLAGQLEPSREPAAGASAAGAGVDGEWRAPGAARRRRAAGRGDGRRRTRPMAGAGW